LLCGTPDTLEVPTVNERTPGDEPEKMTIEERRQFLELVALGRWDDIRFVAGAGVDPIRFALEAIALELCATSIDVVTAVKPLIESVNYMLLGYMGAPIDHAKLDEHGDAKVFVNRGRASREELLQEARA
jgi:hypothetical protein